MSSPFCLRNKNCWIDPQPKIFASRSKPASFPYVPFIPERSALPIYPSHRPINRQRYTRQNPPSYPKKTLAIHANLEKKVHTRLVITTFGAAELESKARGQNEISSPVETDKSEPGLRARNKSDIKIISVAGCRSQQTDLTGEIGLPARALLYSFLFSLRVQFADVDRSAVIISRQPTSCTIFFFFFRFRWAGYSRGRLFVIALGLCDEMNGGRKFFFGFIILCAIRMKLHVTALHFFSQYFLGDVESRMYENKGRKIDIENGTFFLQIGARKSILRLHLTCYVFQWAYIESDQK